MKMCRCPEWTNHLMQMNQSNIAALTDDELLRYIPDNNTGEDGLAALLIEVARRWQGEPIDVNREEELEEEVNSAEEANDELKDQLEAITEERDEVVRRLVAAQNYLNGEL